MNAQIDEEYDHARLLKGAWAVGQLLQYPLWEYRATIPAAVDAITTVMDEGWREANRLSVSKARNWKSRQPCGKHWPMPSSMAAKTMSDNGFTYPCLAIETTK